MSGCTHAAPGPAAGQPPPQQPFACENILVQFSDPQKYFYSENACLVWSCSVSWACLASRENKQKGVCGHPGMGSDQTNGRGARQHPACPPHTAEQQNLRAGHPTRSPERPPSAGQLGPSSRAGTLLPSPSPSSHPRLPQVSNSVLSHMNGTPPSSLPGGAYTSQLTCARAPWSGSTKDLQTCQPH